MALLYHLLHRSHACVLLPPNGLRVHAYRLFQAISHLLRCLRFHAWTFYLFIASDIKTIVLPCSVFSIIASPEISLRSIPLALFWIILHLFLCDVSNQSVSSDEDKLNKPYRPLPSNRISEDNAKRLLVLLYTICFLVSAALGLQWCSVALGLLAFGYNTLGLSGNWFLKNLFNAAAYVCFEYGGTFLAGGQLDRVAGTALLITFGLIITTVHCQDFPDVEGDLLTGRKTLPIQFGQAVSRGLFLISVSFWSVFVPHIWGLNASLRILYAILSVYLGLRVYVLRTVDEDKKSYRMYNVWLAFMNFAVLWARR